MENQEIYLTKDVLGNLNLRVVKTLSHLKLLDNDTLWDKPVALCKRIESNVREVDDVILEANKDRSYFQNSTSNPFCSQMLLSLVYILLYYRHCDDELYKAVVFPALQNNMGIYRSQLLDDIQSKVKKVLEIDRLIEQSKQEKKKNIKPKYSFIHLSSAEADEYFSEFCNEELFNSFSDILEVMKSQYFKAFDVAEIWLTAKDVVQKLWQEKCPENFIDRIYHKLSLSGGTRYVEKGAAESVLLCAYAMMRTVNKSDHFSNTIEYMENIPNGHNDYDLLYNHILTIKQIMDNNVSSFVDYDYTGGTQKSEEMFSKADVERMVQKYAAKVEELNHIIEKKDKTIAEYQEKKRTIDPEEDGEEEKEQEDVLYNKVCFEFFLLLLEYSGFDINNIGNKTRAGELWHMLTGKSSDDFRRYCSTRNYNNNHTKVDIKRLNEKLADMGVKIKL